MRIQVLIKENFKAVIQGVFSCFTEHVVFCGIVAKETGKFKGGKCAVCVEFSIHALLSLIFNIFAFANHQLYFDIHHGVNCFKREFY